jgi:hypothetical protein
MYLGQWLLHPKLLKKKLDVRITGTARTLWHNGRYENKLGWTTLKEPIKTIDDSVVVRVGYAQSRVNFRARHLEPLIYREEMSSALGTRVVITGEDLTGNAEYIGLYAFVICCPYPLESRHVCLQIVDDREQTGWIGYYHENSLCVSTCSR